jgi:uncharacterized protein (UPF0332 family)
MSIMIDSADIFLVKARESLAGADSELANRRYNNCANRCYYACFQAAIAALQRAGIAPTSASGEWSHAFVPSQFDGQLINRRKLYPAELRGTLSRIYALRQVADYSDDVVSETQANRAARRARMLVEAVTARGGHPS